MATDLMKIGIEVRRYLRMNRTLAVCMDAGISRAEVRRALRAKDGVLAAVAISLAVKAAAERGLLDEQLNEEGWVDSESVGVPIVDVCDNPDARESGSSSSNRTSDLLCDDAVHSSGESK